MDNQSDKVCPGCGTVFTLQQLIDDPEVVPLGMQFVDSQLTENMYYFNHARPGCGTTFVVPVTKFREFIDEPIPESNLVGTERCVGHCMAIDELAACAAPCRFAAYRRFLLRMRKRVAPQSGPGISVPISNPHCH